MMPLLVFLPVFGCAPVVVLYEKRAAAGGADSIQLSAVVGSWLFKSSRESLSSFRQGVLAQKRENEVEPPSNAVQTIGRRPYPTSKFSACSGGIRAAFAARLGLP